MFLSVKADSHDITTMRKAPLARRSMDLGNRLIGVGDRDLECDGNVFIRVSQAEWNSVWLLVDSLRERASLAEEELSLVWKMVNKNAARTK